MLHKSRFGLLGNIEELRPICRKAKICLHLQKWIIFSWKIRCCCQFISEQVTWFELRRFFGLIELNPPTTMARLQKFRCAMHCVKVYRPNFANLILPLYDFLNAVYESARNCTKRAVSCFQLVNLSGLLGSGLFKHALKSQVRYFQWGPSKLVFIYTDLSEETYSKIVVQFLAADIDSTLLLKHHDPFSFLSDSLSNTQLGWTILNREAYVLLATLEPLHWLVEAPKNFDLYSDYNNLILIFYPLSVFPNMS